MTDPSTQSAERMNAWDGRVRLFIVGAAVIPVLSALFFESATHPLIIVIDGAAWLIFAADLLVRRRLVPGYLHSGSGRFDALIVFMTFPWYLIPGVGGTLFMSVFRLARLARLVTATGFGRNAYRLFRRLGTLGIWVTAASVLAALMVLHAEPPSSGFSNFGDALWWALVSFTTVGYGDLYPVTPIGRIAGILMMFAGLAALGTVAAVLGTAITSSDEGDADSASSQILRELKVLHADVAELRQRLEEKR